MYTKILVPVDGAELTERAVADSLALAKSLGAAVVGFVVEALAPLPLNDVALAGYPIDVEDHDRVTADHANTVLQDFEARAKALGVPFTGIYARSDDVSGAIADAAAQNGCDLIVMTTHSRSAWSELLFGSQTKHVINRTKLPLLVLH